jgi:hypothetical protein
MRRLSAAGERRRGARRSPATMMLAMDAATAEPSPDAPTAVTTAEPFRFFDNREKYLLFVTTTSEKTEIANRIGEELVHLRPKPPALRVFDAGTGNGVVLSHVLRDLHRRMPTVPFVVVGKEISREDIRLTLATLPDRLAEHPETIVVLTNMFYSEAPWLYPNNPENQTKLTWWSRALDGDTAHDFHQQINDLEPILAQGWQTMASPKSGNPVYVKPSVLVLYRADREFALDQLIPRNIGARQAFGYDLVLAAQPYRSRTAAELKVRTVLVPLARSLTEDGRLVVVQSTGHDPAMEIIRRIWPTEEPFATPRHQLITELERQLGDDIEHFRFESTGDQQSLFTYRLLAMPNEVTSRLSTSTMLAAWNAAVYVAQMDDERVGTVLADGRFMDATRDVVLKHGGLWFQDESFVVVRRPAT